MDENILTKYFSPASTAKLTYWMTYWEHMYVFTWRGGGARAVDDTEHIIKCDAH